MLNPQGKGPMGFLCIDWLSMLLTKKIFFSFQQLYKANTSMLHHTKGQIITSCIRFSLLLFFPLRLLFSFFPPRQLSTCFEHECRCARYQSIDAHDMCIRNIYLFFPSSCFLFPLSKVLQQRPLLLVLVWPAC